MEAALEKWENEHTASVKSGISPINQTGKHKYHAGAVEYKGEALTDLDAVLQDVMKSGETLNIQLTVDVKPICIVS